MSNVEDLITQVQSDDNDAKVETKPAKKSCYWRFFCCYCSCCGPKPSQPAATPLGPPAPYDGTSPTVEAKSSPSPSHGGSDLPPPPHPLTRYLLDPLPTEQKHKKCLVLDLDETLVHSSFKPIPNPDFVISIELEGVIHKVYVRKRPGVDTFMRAVAEKFEVVIFTASLAKYADPLLDILDKDRVVDSRLFRESCVQHYGNYVKDLRHLGRTLDSTVIIDNSPLSYLFQPQNAIPISTWFNDRSDRQLYDLIPFLDRLAVCTDVVDMLQTHKMTFNSNPP